MEELVDAPGPAACRACGGGKRLPFALTMAFQPIMDLATGRVFAQEALVRGPEGQGAGWVIDRLTDEMRYVFDQTSRATAIREAVRLGMAEGEALLSLNFLPNAIYEPETCIRVTLRAAEKAGLPLRRLMLEVTEEERLADPDRLMRIVRAYKAMGFTVAIDDFGAGYAGLGLLADFVPDLVKLDMGLIRGLDRDPQRRAIVRGTVGICHELGIRVVGEGVETPGESDALRDLGVTLQQGYLFARPARDALQHPTLPGRT